MRYNRPINLNNNKGDQVPDNSIKYEEPVDIFEPMIEGKHKFFGEKIYPAHTIILTDGTLEKDHPFTDRVKVYRGLSGNAMTMINKYPSMARVIDPEIEKHIIRTIQFNDPNSKIAKGVSTLTLPKTYYERLEDMNTEDLRDLFLSMNASIKYVTRVASDEKGLSYIPIAPFFNLGKYVGGSQKRVHIQVYFDLNEDGHGSRLESILKAFELMKNKAQCHLCNSRHGEGRRIILENDYWIVFASGSPIRNHHLRFAPREYFENLFDLPRSHIYSLAKVLKVLMSALNDLGVNPNRNIIFNTKPFGYEKSYFHLFGDILPYEYIGGAEMMDDMRVVRESPNVIASKLRIIIKDKYSDEL